MMEERETLEGKSADYQERQIAILKKQLLYSRISAIFIVVLVLVLTLSLIIVVPRLNQVLVQLQQITEDLNDEDLHEMITNINELAETSQKGVQDATEKLNQVDLDALNEAIGDLNRMAGTLAKFFGRN